MRYIFKIGMRIIFLCLVFILNSQAYADSNTTTSSIDASRLEEWYQKGDSSYENKDFSKALIWFRKSAEQGFSPALTNLGRLYEQDLGVKKDLDKALEWYRKAAEQGSELAKKSITQIENR